MKVIVAGGIKKPILLNTDEATSLIILKDDGTPVTIYKFLSDNQGFVRLQKGEDKNFDETASQLGLTI